MFIVGKRHVRNVRRKSFPHIVSNPSLNGEGDVWSKLPDPWIMKVDTP